MKNRIAAGARAGFTLVEVLVTLVLIALLVGVIVPSVINQLDRGEPTRVAQDLESIRSATKLFRVDVKRFPSTLEQLSESPATTWESSADINNADINAALQDRWNGPYLEGSNVSTQAGTLSTALGGEILGVFEGNRTLAGTPYLTVLMTGLTQENAEDLSELIDGDAVVSDDDLGGRVRFVANPTADTTVFLAIPIN